MVWLSRLSVADLIEFALILCVCVFGSALIREKK